MERCFVINVAMRRLTNMADVHALGNINLPEHNCTHILLLCHEEWREMQAFFVGDWSRRQLLSLCKVLRLLQCEVDSLLPQVRALDMR